MHGTLPVRSLAALMVAAAPFLVNAQGDDCSTAVPVTPGTYTADGPSTGAGATNLCFGTGGTNADWYVYTATVDGFIEVSSCSSGGIDTRLSVHTGTCGALTCLVSDDDGCNATFSSVVANVPITQGTDYYIEWDDRWDSGSFQWDLFLIDCTAPVVDFSVVNDCANNQFFIEVDITDLGNANTVDITNTGGAPDVLGAGLGISQVGPFPLGALVNLTVVHDQNNYCDLQFTNVTNPPCPTVSCGPDNTTLCYDNNENITNVYQSANTFPVAVVFNAGTVEVCCDDFEIRDGLDQFAPILFQGNNGGDMTGVIVVSTNPDNALWFNFTSDFSVSCTSQGTYTPLDWTVSCLDCTNPGATYELIPDCFERTYMVEVTVDSTGSAQSVDIVNSLNTDTLFNAGVGTHMVGPFGMDTAVTVTVLNGDNPLCRNLSPSLVWSTDSCVNVTCGFDNFEFCYDDDQDGYFVYQAAAAVPITINFISGNMLVGDKIVLYNGLDDQSALIFNGNNGGDLTGLTFNSNNPDNALALRVITNGTGSCADSTVTTPMRWWVACGEVGIGETTSDDLLVYPNPTTGQLFVDLQSDWFGNVQVQVLDVSGRVVMDRPLTVRTGTTSVMDLSSLQNGNYIVQLITDRWVKAQQVVVAR